MFNLSSNSRDARRELDALVHRQLPFAMSVALTETARDIETNVNKRIARAFDRPTPFTQRAVFVKPASKTRPIALVGIKDKQAEYLEIQETGGTRLPRRRALVLPVQAKVNQYGNLPRAAVSRALARKDTFSGKIGGVAGIWQRRKPGKRGKSDDADKAKLLFAYEPTASYRPRFRFAETADKTAQARFPTQFWRALDRALATGR